MAEESRAAPSWLDPLTPAERALWSAFPRGEVVDLRTGDPDIDNVAGADGWSAERCIRSEVIAALLLGAVSATPGRLAAVRLRGARIVGELDLRDCEVAYPLSVAESHAGKISVDHANCRSMSFRGSRLEAFSLSYGRIEGLLDLRECTMIDALSAPVRVDLGGAEISGAVALSRARIHGEVRCIATQIAGTLRLSGATIVNDAGRTLDGRFLKTGNQLYAPMLHSRGMLELSDARIGASLLLDGALLENGSGDALKARQLTVSGDLSMQRRSRPFVVSGGISMPGARIDGSVRMAESVLSADSCAFHTPGFTVARSLHMTGSTISGTIVMPGATIGEQLDLAGMQITSRRPYAFVGQGLTVAREAQLCPYTSSDGRRRLFSSNATVYLDGATIGGNLRMHGAKLSAHDGGHVLDLSGTQIAHDLQLKDGLTATGEMRLTGASVGGRLNLNGMSSPSALLTLYGAAIGEVVDDDAEAWPNRLDLDGFRYQNMSPYRPAAERVGLFKRQVGGYRPRPYEEMAAYYRRLGHDDEARAVLLARQRARRRSLPIWRRIPGHVADIMTGYGYRPARALGWAAGLWVLGTAYFSRARPQAVNPDEHYVFNPVIYTADQLIPLVHLGNSDIWQPQGTALVVSSALTILGWVLSIAIAAGATRAVSRN